MPFPSAATAHRDDLRSKSSQAALRSRAACGFCGFAAEARGAPWQPRFGKPALQTTQNRTLLLW